MSTVIIPRIGRRMARDKQTTTGIYHQTHERLKTLARESGQPMVEILRILVDNASVEESDTNGSRPRRRVRE